MSETCSTCLWSSLDLNPNSQQNGQTVCKLNPPTPIGIPVPTPQGVSVQVLNLRPIMAPSDFCGMWEGEDSETNAGQSQILT